MFDEIAPVLGYLSLAFSTVLWLVLAWQQCRKSARPSLRAGRFKWSVAFHYPGGFTEPRPCSDATAEARTRAANGGD